VRCVTWPLWIQEFIIVQAIKGLRLGSGSPLFLPAPAFAPPWRGYGWQAKCGCSSVVEHLLAKEDVASSSLVTRSSLRYWSRNGVRLDLHGREILAPAFKLGHYRFEAQRRSEGWSVRHSRGEGGPPTSVRVVSTVIAFERHLESASDGACPGTLATIAQRFSAGYGQSTDPSPGRDERNVLSSLPGLQTIKRGN
jgi:hypothetical protein